MRDCPQATTDPAQTVALSQATIRADDDWSFTLVYANLWSYADDLKGHGIMPRQTTGYTCVAGNTSTLVVAYDRLSNDWKGPVAGARWAGWTVCI